MFCSKPTSSFSSEFKIKNSYLGPMLFTTLSLTVIIGLLSVLHQALPISGPLYLLFPQTSSLPGMYPHISPLPCSIQVFAEM
jgi:uncharacterized membrane protein